MQFDPSSFETITTKKQLSAWVRKLEEQKSFAFDTETTGLNVFEDSLVGIAVSYGDGDNVPSAYIPLAHHDARQLPVDYVLDAFRPVLKSPKVGKIFHNSLYDLLILDQPRYAVEINNVHDSMLMSYVLAGDTHLHNMDFLADRYLGWKTVKFADVVTNRPGRLDFRDVPLSEATGYAAEDTAVTYILAKGFQQALKENGLWGVYTEDRKLIPVLFDMKRKGIAIDVPFLKKLAKNWGPQKAEIVSEAHQVAGCEFNLGSSQQVIEVLEDRGLALPEDRKTGKVSANKFAMELLAGDELVDLIMEYRQVSKLLSTYVVALPTRIVPSTGRVHPNFNITRTSTGRLSSTDPNFQNLSRRSKRGVEIRKSVIAPKGRRLVGADFSQIELRVAGALSRDPVLLRAYEDGIDVHTLTAATIGHKQIEEVKPDEREVAKTANFLALYQGWARQLSRVAKIPYEEALAFLTQYWESLQGLANYVEDVKDFGRSHGYVETMFGRRVYVPYINSRDEVRRRHAERLCVSGAIQGTAADICRRAMVNAHRALKGTADMLIQCHDELIVECAAKDAEKVRDILKYEMENCCEIGVKIVADAKIGKSWYELK